MIALRIPALLACWALAAGIAIPVLLVDRAVRLPESFMERVGAVVFFLVEEVAKP